LLRNPVFSRIDPTAQHTLSPSERVGGFEEVTAGLSEHEARYEAQRCLSCGNCFECDNCHAACPEQAISRLGRGLGYRVDPDLCTGYAMRFEQCPYHAIEMTPEALPETAPVGIIGEPLAPYRFALRE
jgi:Pyruvate/2-oxoacid:ferredoxin oxidoreductase delta subunit